MPFSIPFYRWILTEETSLDLAELSRVTPEVQSTLVRLQELVRQRNTIQTDSSLDAMEKTDKVNNLIAINDFLNGCYNDILLLD